MTNKHKPTKGKQTWEAWQGPRSRHTSRDPNTKKENKAHERHNKEQTCKQELIQTLY